MTTESNNSPSERSWATVRASLLKGLPDLVRQLGANPAPLLAWAGLDPARIELPVADYRLAARLLEHAATLLDCPDLALRLASLQGASVLTGLLGRGMRHAPTLGEALSFASRFGHLHSRAAGIWLRRSRHGSTMVVGHDILLHDLPARRQLIEQMILLGHLNALRLTGGRAWPVRVTFRHQPHSPAASYRRYFGCTVRFGARADALVYHDQALAMPIISCDEAAFRSAVAGIEDRFAGEAIPLEAQVHGIVAHFLNTGLCTRPRVAAELGLHPRTMDRRLAGAGTSFLRIKDQVRRDLMAEYLQRSSLTLARVSEELGFSEQSVLARSSRKWFGMAPTQVRAQAGRPRP